MTAEAIGRRDALRLKVVVAVLIGFGLVIVLSASSVVSIADYGSPWALFERQLMWTAFGVVAFHLAVRFSLARLRHFAVPLLVMTICALVVVLVPHIGKTAGGSSRWVGVGPIRLQPSEFAKLTFAVFAADFVAKRERVRDHMREIVVPVTLVMSFTALLILKQPDMGTAVVVTLITAAIFYGAGVNGRALAVVMSALGVLGAILTLTAPYRRDRVLSFINPFAHASTTGYQVVQSLLALGSGHITGTGLAGSPAIWGFLPNAQTDFIFAVIGNEMGFVGALLVLGTFVVIGAVGLRIAIRATDRFSSMLALGITAWIVCQAFINVGGVESMLPETGIPLPFLSFGGSSLVVTMAAVGLLVNIALHPRRLTRAKMTPPARPRSAPASRAAHPSARGAYRPVPYAPALGPAAPARRARRPPAAAARVRAKPARASGAATATTQRRGRPVPAPVRSRSSR